MEEFNFSLFLFFLYLSQSVDDDDRNNDDDHYDNNDDNSNNNYHHFIITATYIEIVITDINILIICFPIFNFRVLMVTT